MDAIFRSLVARFGDTAGALRSSIPWISLSAGVALSVAVWIGVERSRIEDAHAQFQRQTQAFEQAMRTRLGAYEQMAQVAAAHVAATRSPSRTGWHEFVTMLDLHGRFPGVQAIGFAERVPLAGRAAHVKRVRAEGLAAYDIGPAGERPQYFPIALNEPAGALDARAMGYDAYTEPGRRTAMERARDSGEAAITGRIVLAADALGSDHAGFVLYVPVYRGDARPATPEARDTALAGFVYAVLRMPLLMRGVLDEDAAPVLDVQVIDGAPDAGAATLLDTRQGGDAASVSAFRRAVSFPIDGRTWTVQFTSRPEFDELVARRRSWGLLASGLLASILLFVLTATLMGNWNRAHQLSMRDPLTGLYNRRYLDETIGRELPRARRLQESVGVIALDIDHFKRLNDTFGHDAGDFVLRALGEQLRAATRDSDIACRFGGEEFGIILPGASLSAARAKAEALRASVEALKLEFDGKALGSFTISAGVAAMPPHAQDWTFTLQTADRALYVAKQQGRNRVVAAA
jgi:diguanylate cyclase (GGDEF)-like protein